MKPIQYEELTPELAAAGCLVLNMPIDEYHAHPAISKSGLDLIDRSPAHFRYQAEREPTRAMVIGQAIHAAILEPERFAEDYLLLREVTDRRSSVYKDAIKHRPADFVLTGKEADHVAGMQESVRSNKHANDLLSMPGYAEVSVFATCHITGTLMKCRFDYLTESGIAIDLKKTQDIRYEKVQRAIANYRYHVQDGFYRYVFECATGSNLSAFRFLFIEELMPHATKLYELDDEAKQVGRSQAMDNLNTYDECVKSEVWAYDDSEELISLPTWALDDEDVEVEA